VQVLPPFERERIARAWRHVDDVPRPTPPLIELAIDVERGGPDVAQEDVAGPDQQVTPAYAHGCAAVAATARLEEDGGPLGGEALDDLERAGVAWTRASSIG